MAENVKVIVRCRPMNRREQDMKCKVIVNIYIYIYFFIEIKKIFFLPLKLITQFL